MKHRTVKQITVAAVFFGFWFALGGLITWSAWPEPPAPTPTPRPVKELQAVSASFVRTSAKRADLWGVVLNPNSDAGARKLRFSFVLNEGAENEKTIPGESFILPGSRKYVVALDTDVSEDDFKVALKVEQPAWTFVPSDFSQPSLIVVSERSQVLKRGYDLFEYKGDLKNQSDLDYLKTEVVTVGFDGSGKVIGVHKTFLGSLRSLEVREFTAQWPILSGQEVKDVQAFPDVNVFEPDAVQRRQGTVEERDIPGGSGGQ